ncbi:hypothetical protein ACTFIY_009599 [Dictyostelium cf. discoideum]
MQGVDEKIRSFVLLVISLNVNAAPNHLKIWPISSFELIGENCDEEFVILGRFKEKEEQNNCICKNENNNNSNNSNIIIQIVIILNAASAPSTTTSVSSISLESK